MKTGKYKSSGRGVICCLRSEILLLVCILFSSYSCTDEVVSEEYVFEKLGKLVLSNDISLQLVQDSLNYYIVRGTPAALKQFNSDWQGDTLHLSNPGISTSYFEELWVELHFDDFQNLFLRNGGEVFNEDTLYFNTFSISSNKSTALLSLKLNAKKLYISTSTGSFDIRITGKAENLQVWTTAPGLIDLLAFRADQVICTNASSNDCYVWAEEKLEAKTEYLGRIFYKGEPETILIPEDQEDKILPYK